MAIFATFHTNAASSNIISKSYQLLHRFSSPAYISQCFYKTLPLQSIKEMAYPKNVIMSPYTRPHVVPNSYDYLSYVEKRRYFEECSHCSIPYNVSECGPGPVKLQKAPYMIVSISHALYSKFSEFIYFV